MIHRFFDPDDVIRTGGRMPILASGIDMAKNIGSSVNLGYNVFDSIFGGENIRRGLTAPIHGSFDGKLSVGGILTTGGLAVPGALAGAAIGSMMDGTSIGTAAAVGAGIGAVGLPLVGGGAMWGASKIAEKAWAGLTSSVADGAGITGAAANVGVGLGIMASKTASFGLDMLQSAPARGQLRAMKGIFNNVIDVKKVGEEIEGVGLGWAGHAIMDVSMVAEGAKKAFNAFNTAHMGQMDGQIRRATPMIPAYADNAGASGDLVFALNRNRRG